MDFTETIIARLANLESKLLATKEVLTFDEVAAFTGLSKSYLYKLTRAKLIPHYKPMGKLLYFNRAEITAWMQRGKVATSYEIKGNKSLNYTASRLTRSVELILFYTSTILNYFNEFCQILHAFSYFL